MDISRRDFLHIAGALGLLSATGTNLFAGDSKEVKKKIKAMTFKDIMEFEAKGKATLLHICDLHAHIKPLYWREPSTLISAKNLVGTPGLSVVRVLRSTTTSKQVLLTNTSIPTVTLKSWQRSLVKWVESPT